MLLIYRFTTIFCDFGQLYAELTVTLGFYISSWNLKLRLYFFFIPYGIYFNKLLISFQVIDCVVVLTYLDVKRLAEKEDWVVDNEGITSLVRGRILNNNENFHKTDFFRDEND